MNEMDKKVIFISLKDLATIPSQGEVPKNVTDFQLNYELLEALRNNNNVVRVNILGYDTNTYDWASSEKDLKTILGVATYFVFSYTLVCTQSYCSVEGFQDVLYQAVGNTKKNSLFPNEDEWLYVGNNDTDCVEIMDCISVSEFVNGADGESAMGIEGGEESKEDKA